jgi:hypothetical protein
MSLSLSGTSVYETVSTPVLVTPPHGLNSEKHVGLRGTQSSMKIPQLQLKKAQDAQGDGKRPLSARVSLSNALSKKIAPISARGKNKSLRMKEKDLSLDDAKSDKGISFFFLILSFSFLFFFFLSLFLFFSHPSPCVLCSLSHFVSPSSERVEIYSRIRNCISFLSRSECLGLEGLFRVSAPYTDVAKLKKYLSSLLLFSLLSAHLTS